MSRDCLCLMLNLQGVSSLGGHTLHVCSLEHTCIWSLRVRNHTCFLSCSVSLQTGNVILNKNYDDNK